MTSTMRTISRLYLVIVALVIIVAALGVSFFVSTVITNGESACINRTLGDRNPITKADAVAHSTFATDIAKASHGGRINAKALEAAATRYANELAADQRARDAHPLGKC